MNNENLSISYNKLWKLLIDRGMKKKDLQQASGVSAASIAKLGRNGNVTTEVLLRVCKALGCDISDIMEIVRK
ncbi:helix-turn-helix domain-containing protein [Limosilactobacillus mucosae]|uniref:helix-turn-helix domain-containing protein n=1 Tax=Limosilactobacillus pulli TaxID=2991833 RepID=UPI001C3A0F13|nr:helix-turn-helix transcriptional regulator [Limosilactobacillus pulli]HJA47238.1 helix-turn-helix transcriptional regulator [Candidatus Limosilactobacillus excrementigallinarum]